MRVVVYGLGKEYEDTKEFINDQYEVIALCDKTEKAIEHFVSIKDLNLLAFEAVYIASYKYYKEIRAELEKIVGRDTIFLNRENLVGYKTESQSKEGTYVDSNSSIGEYTYLGRNCLVTKASIGRYCSIGNNVSIGPGEHRLSRISTSAFLYENKVDWYAELTDKEVQIGNDVWIGTDSIIRRGVTIGDGAVIGANSFVNRDVPPFAIVAGSPAKLIRFRFSDEKIAKITESKWWEKDLEEARNIVEKLESI